MSGPATNTTTTRITVAAAAVVSDCQTSGILHFAEERNSEWPAGRVRVACQWSCHDYFPRHLQVLNTSSYTIRVLVSHYTDDARYFPHHIFILKLLAGSEYACYDGNIDKRANESRTSNTRTRKKRVATCDILPTIPLWYREHLCYVCTSDITVALLLILVLLPQSRWRLCSIAQTSRVG